MLAVLLICVFSYFLGAIPTGYCIGKWVKGIDIREVGSRSTGATNVARSVGFAWGVFVMVFDMLKGAVPVLLAIAVCDPQGHQSIPLPDCLSLTAGTDLPKWQVECARWYVLPFFAALIALIAHSKSIFLGFQGGKSAATGLGALAAMSPLAGLCMFTVFVVTILVGRYVSLGSIAAAAVGPFFMHLFTHGDKPSFVIFNIVGSSYVIIRHKTNIQRLLKGTERKIGEKAEEVKEEPAGVDGKAEKFKEDSPKDGDGKANSGLKILLALALSVSVFQSAGSAEKPQAKKTAIAANANDKGSKSSPGKSGQDSAKEPNVFISAPPAPITADEATNIRVYKQDSKAVVNVTTVNVTPEAIMFGMTAPSETGSGSIISPDGYILTNNHVVNNARMVRVSLFDGTSFAAKLVGVDPDNDLAVLKIDPGTRKLSVIKFGDSSRLEVGRRVFAIGNPFGLDLTMTSGIISSVGRTMRTENGRVIKGVIQTDAAINPGNSGGPLLDTQGNMIGVTTAILGKVQQSAGIGFAIPINVVKRIVPQLVAHGVVMRPNLGILKVTVTDVGLMISALDLQGPAAEAGLRGPAVRRGRINGFDFMQVDNSAADVIVGIDSQRVSSVDDLLSYVETKKPGQVVTLNVLRQGQVTRVPVKLAETKVQP